MLSLCMTSSIFVGCSKEKPLYNENVEATVTSNEDNDVKMLKKEDALKLVEKEVKKVFPNAKLKLKSDDYPNTDGFYLIQYDTPYCTTAEFAVDPYTGSIQSCEEGTSNYIDMDTWKENIDKYSNSEIFKITTGKEAMAKFVSKYNFNETHERPGWIELSDNQLSNFELVSNELVEYKPGECAWVFRYPMEEEQSVYESRHDDDCTRSNAVNKNDKYGYMFFEPLRLDSSDKSSWYYSNLCDGYGTYFFWEDYPSSNNY